MSSGALDRRLHRLSCFGISWKLTLISLVVAPLLTLFLQPVLRRLRHGYRVLRNDHGEMMSVLQESVSGIRLVKSFAAEAYEDRTFTDASHKYSGGLVRMARIAAHRAADHRDARHASSWSLLLWIGAQEVFAGQSLQASQFLVFLAFVMRLLQPMKQLSQIPAVAQNSFASAERIFQVLDHPTEKRDLDHGTRASRRVPRRRSSSTTSPSRTMTSPCSPTSPSPRRRAT